ncbi:unnamed protein product [Arabis nemorensis]|uniref:Uncharacterized protein n=1 Tax=Arabis nemorensis TaxID=586526 RepID=A0A565B4C2_9BRAS|nr:unnamed protein product [Arabis nemorensis]
MQALDTNTFSFGASVAPRRTIFRSRKASASATDTSFSFGPAQVSDSDSNIPKTPSSSFLPGFGVGYFPGSSLSTPVCGSVSAALKTTGRNYYVAELFFFIVRYI